MKHNEIDALLNEDAVSGGGEAPPEQVSDDEIGWDDVKQEMELGKVMPAKTEVTETSFNEIKKSEPVRSSLDMNFILDIPLTLNVELGRSRMLISELLQLGQGSVIELTKLAGEPMDIYVNQRLIARGEVVVVNEKFGIRLTDIVSPAERVNKLR
jgi:flagellar motor switch protein FliN/FliY